MTFTQGFRKGLQEVDRGKELKALRKAPETADRITIKVTGTTELTRFMDRGWELVSSVPLGRGAGFTQYIITKKRSQLVLDTAA